MKMTAGFPERSPAREWMRADVCGAAGRSLGRLGAQQSLNGRVDVPARGDERLQVGLTVNEAHGVQLLQLLLESHFGTLRLQRERTKRSAAAVDPGTRRSGGSAAIPPCLQRCHPAPRISAAPAEQPHRARAAPRLWHPGQPAPCVSRPKNQPGLGPKQTRQKAAEPKGAGC